MSAPTHFKPSRALESIHFVFAVYYGRNAWTAWIAAPRVGGLCPLLEGSPLGSCTFARPCKGGENPTASCRAVAGSTSPICPAHPSPGAGIPCDSLVRTPGASPARHPLFLVAV
eukprot:GGOE01035325.1.p4 GENE.GGOE01035325.1~~GGOE01035325.1.p4  ORF type:complete len:114 (-),score=2.99 GGOE01035325.1:265-606(-)